MQQIITIIDSCDMSSNPTNTTWGPYYGVALIGSSSQDQLVIVQQETTISNSNIQHFQFLWNFWSYYTGGDLIVNNTIHNSGITRYTTKYAIYMYYSMISSLKKIEFII
jgi:hypothetical protein